MFQPKKRSDIIKSNSNKLTAVVIKTIIDLAFWKMMEYRPNKRAGITATKKINAIIAIV